MKIPINCPICNNILLTEFLSYLNKDEVCIKRCNNISHIFRCASYPHSDKVSYLTIKFNDNEYEWNFKYKNLILRNYNCKNSLNLTFFYPDFCDVNKLKNKLETCVLFS